MAAVSYGTSTLGGIRTMNALQEEYIMRLNKMA